MASGVTYEGGFIVGGSPGAKLTPNFRLREFSDRSGRVHIHRELVSSLQVLRSAYEEPIEIVSQKPSGALGRNRRGLFAWIRGTDGPRLRAEAKALVRSGWLNKATARDGQIFVEVHEPGRIPPVPARRAFAFALTVTATFETGGLRPFEAVTGNFDKAGMSFGPIQSNFGSGTLQELFRDFRSASESRLRACFGGGADYEEWLRVLESSREKQIAWADARSIGSNKARVAQPWRRYLENVGRQKKFQDIMVAQAYTGYGSAMVKSVNWLAGVAPIPVRHNACLASLFDLCVQQGGLDKAHRQIRRRVEQEQPRDEFDLVRIAVTERGKRANERWRADCVSRRLTILDLEPVSVTESGFSATRRNLNLYLIRDAKVRGLESYLVSNRGKPGVG